MKKKSIAILLALLMIIPVSFISAQVANQLKIEEIVTLMKDKDLDLKIEELSKHVSALRSAYTPAGAHLGTWPSTYRLAIAPLLGEIEVEMKDYQELNDDLRKEVSLYQEASRYWISQESVKINKRNLNLANQEYLKTKSFIEQGKLAQNELIQSEISVNNAQIQLTESEIHFNQLLYQINYSTGQAINSTFEIVDPSFQFISASELNIINTLKEVKDSHPSLNSNRVSVRSYQKALEIVEGQDNLNFSVPIDGLREFYKKEIELSNLELQRQHERLEIMVYSYIGRLEKMQKNIQVLEENMTKNEQLYKSNVIKYEQGLVISLDLEKIRVNDLNIKIQLSNAKADYLQAVKEYHLFKKGYL